ncbi:MAG: hydrolase [Vicinamibacteria bacterium]|nr:hydrolase [Vicinamibacteria bacterium]
MSKPRLSPQETLLVVVDMQERLLPAIHEHPRVVAATRLMLRAAKVLDLPVLMTTQYLKGLGPTHAEVAELAPSLIPFDKLTFSCFGSSEFRRALTATKRKTLLLCGVEAHVCVLQTGLDALAAGYSVHLATDATSSRTSANAQLGQRRLERAGSILTSSEMAIYELLGASGSPAFKALLPHFK